MCQLTASLLLPHPHTLVKREGECGSEDGGGGGEGEEKEEEEIER